MNTDDARSGRRTRAFAQRTLLEIHRVACEVGLADRREILVGALSHGIRAKLVDPARRADRLLADLHLLNGWIDVDGAAPLLAEWLLTAARLLEPRPEAARFSTWAADAGRPCAPRRPADSFETHPELRAARRHLSTLRASRAPEAEVSDAADALRAVKRRLRSGGALAVGDVLADRFVLGEHVGGGGFASVWRAYDEQLATEVAVKVLHGRWNRDASRIDRFCRGARKLALLHDVPGVVDLVAEVAADDHWHFFAMEFLDGGDLQAATLRPDPLPIAGGLGAVVAAAEALAEAHRRSMVHRDVKPGNILLDSRGRSKVADFDLVLAADSTGGTGSGPLGTVLYAAPELLDRPGEAGPAADVYGLAMTAVFVLHRAELPRSMIRRPDTVLAGLPVSAPLRALLERSIAWEPGRRPVDGGAFAMALRAAIGAQTFGELAAVDLIAGASPPAEAPPAVTAAEAPARAAAPRTLPASDRRPALVWLPPGRFVMGSPLLEWGRRGDEQQHPVALSRGLWMAEAPLTGEQYRRITGARRGKWDPAAPVTGVTWVMAATCCNALSEVEGLRPAYVVDGRTARLRPDADGYRLPTEAEWEYACRAGTTTRFWCGEHDHQVAVVGVCLDGGRRRVEVSGGRPANPWGLRDMHGNVWEWCHDAMGLYPAGAVTDPVGPASGARRVVRGGAYNTRPLELRSAARAARRATDQGDDVGFRVVRPG